MSSSIQIPQSLYEALRAKAGLRPRFIEDLHGSQRAFVVDQSSRKSAVCGRRAGKSSGIGAWLVEGMISKPGTRSVYVGVTAAKAKQVLWDLVLTKMVKKYGLPLTMTTPSGQHMVRHSNGSTLWLVGCKDRSEMEKFRGEAYYRFCIDEAQTYGDWLQAAIADAIEPALLDYQGALAVCGTPSPAAVGFFHDVSTGAVQGWSWQHHWTFLDNPFMEGLNEPSDRSAWLENYRVGLGWGIDHPTYRREWLGEWIDDAGALIYPFSSVENAWTPSGEGPYGLPPGEYRYGLGVDLGFGEQSTAFVLVADRVGFQELYVLKAYKRTRLIPNALAAHVQQVRANLLKETGAHLTVVVDEGALGKGYAEQMRALGVGCIPAQKVNKRTYQEYVRGLITSGNVKASGTNVKDLLDEARKVQFDPETGQEDERYVRHCCDAFLYITRQMFPRLDADTLAKGAAGPPRNPADTDMAKYKQHLIKEREKRQRRLAS